MATTIYYWPLLMRIRAVLGMLEETKTPYVWKKEYGDIAAQCTGFGGGRDTFAPPVIQDGDNLISQSLACTMHIGEKCGFAKGIKSQAKAVQYMLDLRDFMEQCEANKISAARLAEFVKGPGGGKVSYFDEWMTNIERSIQGPYYFGENLTYVDFFACQVFDYVHFTIFGPVGVDEVKRYPKIHAMVTAIRGMASAHAFAHLPWAPASYFVTEELVTQYKALN